MEEDNVVIVSVLFFDILRYILSLNVITCQQDKGEFNSVFYVNIKKKETEYKELCIHAGYHSHYSGLIQPLQIRINMRNLHIKGANIPLLS